MYFINLEIEKPVLYEYFVLQESYNTCIFVYILVLYTEHNVQCSTTIGGMRIPSKEIEKRNVACAYAGYEVCICMSARSASAGIGGVQQASEEALVDSSSEPECVLWRAVAVHVELHARQIVRREEAPGEREQTLERERTRRLRAIMSAP